MKPIIVTRNFFLRRCSHDDVEDYLLFWNDAEVMKYIGDGTWGGGRNKVMHFLNKNIEEYAKDDGLGYFCLVDKSTNQVVGEAGLSKLAETGEIEVGYILRKDYWGKGFGTELLTSLIQYGFKNLGLKEIVAVCHPENIGSQKLMKKCNMKFIGKGRYHNRDSLKYSISSF